MEGLADVRSTVLVDDLSSWVREVQDDFSNRIPRFYYSKKYLPSSTVFKDLSEEDLREARDSFAAFARSEQFSRSLQSVGQCVHLSIAADSDGEEPAETIGLWLRHGGRRSRLREHVSLRCEWRSVLNGQIFQYMSKKGVQPLYALEAKASGKDGRGGSGKGSDRRARARSDRAGSEMHDAEEDAEPPGEELEEQHAVIEWLGPMQRKDKDKRYYRAARLPNGEVVKVDGAVKLLAPEGETSYLAKVTSLWENVADGYKMMRTVWYYRPGEARSPHPDGHAHAKEVFLSTEADSNYLTTIEKPCEILHEADMELLHSAMASPALHLDLACLLPR